MVLISEEEEKLLFNKFLSYYQKVYPHVKFSREETMLGPKEIEEISYTYPGEEIEVTFEDKVREIEDALSAGYSTPVIILRKKDKDILIDGHRRLRVAWNKGLEWKALLIIPDREVTFGIEKIVRGRIGNLWKKA